MGNSKIRITADLAEAVKAIPLPCAAQKLFLALLYLQDLTDHRWSRLAWEERAEMQFFCELNDLRALGCAPRAGNTRHFKTAIDALTMRSDLVRKIALSDVPGYLTWSFSPGVWKAMSKMEPYGLMEVGAIGQISSRLDLMLLTQMVVQHRKLKPEFVLSGADLGLATADAVEPGIFGVNRLRRPLMSPLRKWARHFETSIVLGFEQGAREPGYRRVRIRFHGPQSVWTTRTIKKFAMNTKVVPITR